MGATVHGMGLRVLVVDDDSDTADSTARLLQLYGAEVQKAYDGTTAIERSVTQCPDLVLLDLAMPAMDGYAVADALGTAKLPKRPFLVAMSGYSDEVHRRRCVEAGFDLHLTKPINLSMVLRLLALLRGTTDLGGQVGKILIETATVQDELLHAFLDTAERLFDLAATSRNAETRRSCLERAQKARALVERNLQTVPKTAAQVLLQRILHDKLSELLAIDGASMGNIQLLNPQGYLEIAAQRGFDTEFLRYFHQVSESDTSSYGRALRYRTTIAIEDVGFDPRFEAHRAAAAAANFRAVCSSPLIVPDGRIVGVVSTHFEQPHAFSFSEIEAHARHARQTASLIDWASA